MLSLIDMQVPIFSPVVYPNMYIKLLPALFMMRGEGGRERRRDGEA